MRRSRLAVSLILGLIGLVWIGQGVGMIGGSAMTGSSFWAAAGLILVVLAAVIVAREYRLTPRS
jgi:hypothetical protein